MRLPSAPLRFNTHLRGRYCTVEMQLLSLDPPQFTVQIDNLARPLDLTRDEISKLCRLASKIAEQRDRMW